MSENLHKSAEGWVRTNGRREVGKPVRGWHLEHRPRSTFRAGKPRLDRTHVVRDQGYDEPEVVAVSACGLCAEVGRCSGACLVE